MVLREKGVFDVVKGVLVGKPQDEAYYEQYKDSESTKEREWAMQAKARANKTAMSYNEYVLKNSFVWEDNIPEDIASELAIIK